MLRWLSILILSILWYSAPAMAQTKKSAKKEVAPTISTSDLLKENPYWINVEKYDICRIKDGEVENVSNSRIPSSQFLYHIEQTLITTYRKKIDVEFARGEFNKGIFIKESFDARNTKSFIPLNNGNIAMIKSPLTNKGFKLQSDTYSNVTILAPVTKLKFITMTNSDPSRPTLKEYFSDAKRVPLNLKKVLRSTNWKEQREMCKVEDGVVKVLGLEKSPFDIITFRTFTNEYSGEYFSYNFKKRKIFEEGEFNLDRKDFLYSADNDIIYLPQESLSSSDTIYYYRLSPQSIPYAQAKRNLQTPTSASQRISSVPEIYKSKKKRSSGRSH